jgi:hypothetical protein
MPEVTLPQAIEKLKSDDVIGAFEAYYRAQHAADPESWPLSLDPSEWTQALSDFLMEYDLGTP